MLTNRIVDNDEGISIIDVTDPASPRYCMVLVSAFETERRNQPLSAKEYVECYYQSLDTKEYNTAWILTAHEGLLSTPLIDMAILAEAWPAEYRDGEGDYVLDKDDSNPETDVVNEGPEDEERSERIPSLATMAILKAIHAMLQDKENADQIEFLLRVPMGQDSIDAVIASLAAASQLPDYIVPLIAKAVSPIDGYIDLSQFALTGNQILQVAKLIPTCKVLKLGGRMNADIDDVVNTTKCFSDLDTVILFGDLVSVKQLALLRRELPSDRIRIAYRKEYFQYAKGNRPQYTRHNVPEFVFILEAMKKWSYDPPTISGVGVEVLDDPNFIIQTVRDFLCVEYHFEAASIGFTMKKRGYRAPYLSSVFASLAARMERENPDMVQWGFVGSARPYPLALKYGFFRYQHGSPLQLMDVDGFVTALAKERPDLPLIEAGPTQPGARFASFLDEVRYLLETRPGDNEEMGVLRLSVKQAEKIILGL
jgi:hypothetical protein